MKCLKSVSVLFAFVSIVSLSSIEIRNPLSATNNQQTNEALRQCNMTYKIDTAILTELYNSGTIPDEAELNPKCFLYCAMEKLGMINSNGQMNATIMEDSFKGTRNGQTMTEIPQVVKGCTEQNDGDNNCEKAYNLVKCVMTNEVEKYGTD